MKRLLIGLRNLVFWCLAFIGLLLVLIVYFGSRNQGTIKREPTATLAPTPAIALVKDTATPVVQAHVFLPSLQVAATSTPLPTLTPIPTPNIVATQQVERAQRVAAQNQERILNPPVGTWCANNSERQVCVGDFRYETEIDGDKVGTNSRYIALYTGARNIGGSSIHVNPLHFTLIMSDGQTYGYDVATFDYWDRPLDAIDVAQDDRIQGGLVFYVQSDVAPERVIYRGIWESEIVIDLTEAPVQ